MEPALEAGIGDEVALALADKAGVDEARWAGPAGDGAECQNLFDELVHQLWH
jgi:hypothetical protein